MTTGPVAAPVEETPELRKSRGAFFTPSKIAEYLVKWAVRNAQDRVLEPSCGDAAFLVPVVSRLQSFGEAVPVVDGVEIHLDSVEQARSRVVAAGGSPKIIHSDFFDVAAEPRFDAVVGNPPFIRYQDFAGAARTKAREASLRAGVALSGLASSWAAFAVHSIEFLRPGGRLALVLPAELLSVNYAAAVRKHLFESFASIELVTFNERIFPEAETEVVLLMADGFKAGPTDHATIYQADNEESLTELPSSTRWAPLNSSSKWMASLHAELPVAFSELEGKGMAQLQDWGDTTLGMVTGNNRYFALSQTRVSELGIARKDLLAISPPGSSHLRGLTFTRREWNRLRRAGAATWLFRPERDPVGSSAAYIESGVEIGVDEAYKCRVRTPWWRVPLQPAADVLVTYMNAATPMLATNSAGVHHLNSVHGLYLNEDGKELAHVLPLAALNSATMLSAELVGRSYGGGILKLEPREADSWLVPSVTTVKDIADALLAQRRKVLAKLRERDLQGAAAIVDEVVLRQYLGLDQGDLEALRASREHFAARRKSRSDSGR